MDPNLISITTIPINIEINIVKGELRNPNSPKPQMNIQTSEGGYQIKAEPAKINIDTYAARSSMGYGKYNFTDFNKTEAQKGLKLAYEGTARVVNEGNSYIRGQKASDIAMQNNRAGTTIQTIMEFFPKEGADITFEEGTLNINYELSDMNIDWENLQTVPLEFHPGSIEFIVKERPRVEIEYVGGPIYVPPSADPHHNPLNIKG